jgi:hypothetical protein
MLGRWAAMMAVGVLLLGGAPGAAPAGQWSSATLSEGRQVGAVATVGSKVLFAGGVNSIGPSAVVDVYDDATGQWTSASLSQRRLFMAVATVGNRSLFAGGMDYGTGSNAVDIYTAATPQ